MNNWYKNLRYISWADLQDMFRQKDAEIESLKTKVNDQGADINVVKWKHGEMIRRLTAIESRLGSQEPDDQQDKNR